SFACATACSEVVKISAARTGKTFFIDCLEASEREMAAFMTRIIKRSTMFLSFRAYLVFELKAGSTRDCLPSMNLWD
ncbi:MAG: hypothetical protein V2I35_10795, partial [Desulfocapsaceae bacterium]|nr:hypothetical protein [Desulfocapsaceae bacterium]